METAENEAASSRRPPVRALALLRHAGLLADPGAWVVEDRVLALAYPRRETGLRTLAARGVTLLVNLHRRPHDPARLRRHGLTEVHLPVPDFAAPAPDQLARGVAAIDDALAAGGRVAVHCGAGLGRTGTLLACLLVARGATPPEAIARVRAARPGSIETATQVAAVHAFAATCGVGHAGSTAVLAPDIIGRDIPPPPTRVPDVGSHNLGTGDVVRRGPDGEVASPPPNGVALLRRPEEEPPEGGAKAKIPHRED